MNEGFLSRWSRLKRSPDASPGDAKTADEPSAGSASAADEGISTQDAGKRAPPGAWSGRDPSLARVDPKDLAPEVTAPGESDAPELPAIDSLVPSSDFRPFMQPGVPAGSRNAALKKLFADPAFNVMDGLDTYIDDYSIPSPIPPAMLKSLMENHVTESARAILFEPHRGEAECEGDGLAMDPVTAQSATLPVPGPRIAHASEPEDASLGAGSMAADSMAAGMARDPANDPASERAGSVSGQLSEASTAANESPAAVADLNPVK